MKYFAAAVVVVGLVAQITAAPIENADESTNVEVREAVPDTEVADNVRFRKSAYGQGAASYGPGAASYGQGAASYGPGASAGSGSGSGSGGGKQIFGGMGVPMTYSYPSPAPTMPCARNLLFSCQPSVAPVPCAAPAPAPAPVYAGAYSDPVPQWVYPQLY